MVIAWYRARPGGAHCGSSTPGTQSRHDRAFAAELFLFLAARADLVERVIRPALAAGQIVIGDRFGLSTMAYQVAGRGLSRDDVAAALRIATGGLTADLTLVLDVPVRGAGWKGLKTVSAEDARSPGFVGNRRASGPGLSALMLVRQEAVGSRVAGGGRRHGRAGRSIHERHSMIRHKGSVVAVVTLAALVSGGWFLQRGTEPAGSVYQQARLFDDVLAHVADYYVDSLDERQLYQMAIDGMLDQLGDPYSVFLKPDDFRQLSEATTGNYSGLGIRSTCA
jgi:hypothetical protein